jgi:hypothetical protein
MAPELLPSFVAPLLAGEADYAKGNRFYELDRLSVMLRARLVGQRDPPILSVSTAIEHCRLDQRLRRSMRACCDTFPREDQPALLFESDMLFRLNTLRAVVVDADGRRLRRRGQQPAIARILPEFAGKHRAISRSDVHNYFLWTSRSSLELPPASRCWRSRWVSAAITGHVRRPKAWPRRPARS